MLPRASHSSVVPSFAFNQQTDNDIRLAPAHEGFDDHSESTAVKTTEHRPDKTLPDGGHEPIDKTTLPTDPKEEPTTTEKKKEPHNTEPHGTEPHNTEPGDGDGEPTTTDGEEHHYEWSVHQLKGSTDAEPVTEVFWGTANPGDKIRIESAYGSATVYAGDGGGWEAHVTFEGAPVGVAFSIYVHAPEHDATFSFTYWG